MDCLEPTMGYVQPVINLAGWAGGAETGAILGLIDGIRETSEWIGRSPSLGPSLDPILTYGLMAYQGCKNLKG